MQSSLDTPPSFFAHLYHRPHYWLLLLRRFASFTPSSSFFQWTLLACQVWREEVFERAARRDCFGNLDERRSSAALSLLTSPCFTVSTSRLFPESWRSPLVHLRSAPSSLPSHRLRQPHQASSSAPRPLLSLLSPRVTPCCAKSCVYLHSSR